MKDNNSKKGTIMIKYILTDLDGVIRKWNNRKLQKIEKEMSISKSNLLSVCFERQLLRRVITGEISDSTWRQIVDERYSRIHNNIDTREIIESWINSEYTIDYGIFELYREYYPDAKIVLLTNATSKLNSDLKGAKIYDMFDFIFNSSEMGTIKPDVQYYEKVKMKIGFENDEVVYIDDSVVNINAANSFGLKSLLYENHLGLKEFLSNSMR